MRYRIEFSPRALEHLAALATHQRPRVLAAIEAQLSVQPTTPTRNRKRLRPNVLADWELRVGDLRVYYIVSDELEHVVSIIAVGRKVRNRVIIAGEELRL